MIASAELRAEVLARLRELTTAHPDRTSHLAIDVAQRGQPLSIPAVQAALYHLWEHHQVVHTGRGWRLRPDDAALTLEVHGG